MASREEENVEVTFYYTCVRHLFVILSFRNYIHIHVQCPEHYISFPYFPEKLETSV